MPASTQSVLPTRRRCLAGLALGVLAGPGLAAGQPVGAVEPIGLRDGDILLLRHAHAPGVGDPPDFVLGDCRRQRNLDAAGRAQARRIGAALRALALPVAAVRTSRWCRARETAELIAAELGGAAVQEDARFDSFFATREEEPARTTAARAVLQRWAGPGLLLVVTHQVNIAALTGLSPASGEAVALRPLPLQPAAAGRVELRVLGRQRFE